MSSLLHKIALPVFSSKGPWGDRSGRPTKPRQTSNNPQADLDDMLRQAQDRVRDMMGSGGGAPRGGDGGGVQLPLGLIGIGVLAVWLFQCFYVVQPDEQGVVTRFGEYVETTDEGLHFRLWPIENVVKPKVTRENIVEVGFKGSQTVRGFVGNRLVERQLDNSRVIDVPQESLMLTGDENIVDLDFTVRWRIADPKEYLFNVSDPDSALKRIAESAMREVVGRYPIDAAITTDKETIQDEATTLIQQISDSYGMGMSISGVELQQVQPPQEVMDAFRDVQAAKADAEKVKNQATGYANDIVPRARGEAAQILQDAEAYKASKIAGAEGDANRFNSQVREYWKAKAITKKRLYLETMEEVLKDNQKVILSKEAGAGVLPYLPLNKQGGVK